MKCAKIDLFDFDLFNKDEHIVNVKNMLLYIKSKQEASSLKVKVYTDGEFDSNQTLFEKMSNHLQIGVKASSRKSQKFAVCLLRVLRCMIDYNHNLNIFWWMPDEKFHFYEGKNWKGYTWDKIIEIMDKQFNNYVSEFDLDGIAETTLCGHKGKTEIKKPTKDIALWDVDDLLKFVVEIGEY